jgi:hypothetical protein
MISTKQSVQRAIDYLYKKNPYVLIDLDDIPYGEYYIFNQKSDKEYYLKKDWKDKMAKLAK